MRATDASTLRGRRGHGRVDTTGSHASRTNDGGDDAPRPGAIWRGQVLGATNAPTASIGRSVGGPRGCGSGPLGRGGGSTTSNERSIDRGSCGLHSFCAISHIHKGPGRPDLSRTQPRKSQSQHKIRPALPLSA